MNTRWILPFFGLISVMFFSGSVLAESDTQELQQQLKKLSEKIEALTKLVGDSNTNTADISNTLKEVSTEAGKLSSDVVVLESGGTVLGKDKTSADSLKQQIDALNSEDTDIGTKRQELIGKMEANFTGLKELRFQKLGDSDSYPNKPHAFLKNLIDAANEGLEIDHISKIDSRIEDESQRLKPKLEAFIQSAADFLQPKNGQRPVVVLVNQMTALAGELNGINGDDFNNLDGAQNALKALNDEIQAKLPKTEQSIVQQVESTATKLIDLLPGAKNDEPLKTQRELIQQTPSTLTALTNLDQKISETKGDAGKLVVRLIEAKYGDYPPKRFIRKRWCDATSVMRNSCNRQTSCEVPEKHSRTVCGYNPAPAAAAYRRGLYVRYECVYNLDTLFNDGLAAVDGHMNSNARLSKNADDYVVLREGGSIVCSK